MDWRAIWPPGAQLCAHGCVCLHLVHHLLAQSCARSLIHPICRSLAPSLQRHLHPLPVGQVSFLKASVAGDRFGILWRGLAVQLDSFFFKHVLLHPVFTHLSYSQARQLQVDVEGMVLLLFAPFTRNPLNYLSLCGDACKLLVMRVEERKAIRAKLQVDEDEGKAMDTEGHQEMLQKHGISKLNVEQIARFTDAIR